MKFSKTIVVASLSLLALTAQAQIVTNGSFEDNLQAGGSWSIYSSLVGWTGMSNIELRNNVSGVAQEGSNYVELDTTNNMSMKQLVSIGNAGMYELSFWYSAREQRAAGDNGLSFSFGALSGSVLENTAGLQSGNDWRNYKGLVALNGDTELIFSGIGRSNSYGGSLDNVAVTAVPEPETYAMLLAGLGLMGVMVRRRKARLAA
jgi:hypothetical protein